MKEAVCHRSLLKSAKTAIKRCGALRPKFLTWAALRTCWPGIELRTATVCSSAKHCMSASLILRSACGTSTIVRCGCGFAASTASDAPAGACETTSSDLDRGLQDAIKGALRRPRSHKRCYLQGSATLRSRPKIFGIVALLGQHGSSDLAVQLPAQTSLRSASRVKIRSMHHNYLPASLPPEFQQSRPVTSKGPPGLVLPFSRKVQSLVPPGVQPYCSSGAYCKRSCI